MPRRTKKSNERVWCRRVKATRLVKYFFGGAYACHPTPLCQRRTWHDKWHDMARHGMTRNDTTRHGQVLAILLDKLTIFNLAYKGKGRAEIYISVRRHHHSNCRLSLVQALGFGLAWLSLAGSIITRPLGCYQSLRYLCLKICISLHLSPWAQCG